MAQVTCRCGEILNVPSQGTERLTCPRCQAKIRVRRSAPTTNGAESPQDGYIRFYCPCGRRLKVSAEGQPSAGKCPDCGRLVPVPSPDRESAQPRSWNPQGWQATAGPETHTEDLDAADLQRLAEWAARHQGPGAVDRLEDEATDWRNSALPSDPVMPSFADPPRGGGGSMEAGLRVCGRCGAPLHMSASVCRECGEHAPQRANPYP